MPRENPGHQKWIASVQEITGEWNGIQAPKCDRSPGRIQGSEEDSLKVVIKHYWSDAGMNLS